jgi:hypothetical protein
LQRMIEPALPIQLVVKIAPFPIIGVDQPNLPCARPVLDVALSLDGSADVFVELHPDEPLQTITTGEPFDEPLVMLIGAPRDIRRHAGIERSVWTVRHYLDPAAAHG